MNKITKICAILLSFQLLTGCAAMLVPSTSDPATKLAWAQELIEKQDRPLPAERLIREAIDIYREQKDEIGVAHGYRMYGIFFNAPALRKWQKYYQENGFLDKSASYDTRFQKALEYLDKSLSIATNHKDINMPANLYVLTGFAYQNMQQTAAACLAFDKSIVAYKLMVAQNSQVKASVPKEYSSFENGINDFKKRAACKS